MMQIEPPISQDRGSLPGLRTLGERLSSDGFRWDVFHLVDAPIDWEGKPCRSSWLLVAKTLLTQQSS